MGRTQLEFSGFNGTEPEPTKVDLPIGALNSYGARIAYQFSDQVYAMISTAEVKNPEPNDPTLEKVWRYSGSIYSKNNITESVVIQNALIYGHVINYDHVPLLRSILNEFWIHENDRPHQYWGRFEFVERTAAELMIFGQSNPVSAKWVTAITAGYTYKLKLTDTIEGGIGGSITKDILPSDFQSSYSTDPLSGRLFVQLSGMKMGQF